MLRTILIGSLLLISSSGATTLDEIIASMLQHNQNIKSLEQSIDVASEQIKISKNWKNPTLTIGANDIHFDEPTSRDLEPMQAQYIGFSQVIPVGDKLDIAQSIAQQEQQIAQLKLADKKLLLVSKIHEYVYSILVLEKKHKLLLDYQANIKSLEQLLTALYQNGKITQNSVLKAQIAYSKVELKRENLKNIIKRLYLKPEELSYLEINHIKTDLEVKDRILSDTVLTHPKVKILKEKSKKQMQISNLELAKKNSDIKVNIAYFQRDRKYKDYANVSVNIPLSIYGTENIKALKGKIKSQAIENTYQDLIQQFKTELKILEQDLKSSYRNYHLLNESIIPLKMKTQENFEAYNSLGQIKPQETIKNLNDVIAEQMNALDEMKKYFSALSKALYLTQGKL